MRRQSAAVQPLALLRRPFSTGNAPRTQYAQQQAACRGRAARRRAVQTSALLGGLFGKKSDDGSSTRRKYQQRVDEINSLEPRYQAMSDQELQDQTPLLQKRVKGGEALESVLPEAFAVSPLNSSLTR